MTENTNSSEKKVNRKIKATTGAWWKSTVVEEVEETSSTIPDPQELASSQDLPTSENPPELEAESAKTEKQDGSRRKTSSAPESGHKKRGRRPSQKKSAATTDLTQEGEEGSPAVEEGASEPEGKVAKPRRGRGRRSKKQPSTVPAAEVEHDGETVEPATASENDGQAKIESAPAKEGRGKRPGRRKSAKKNDQDSTAEERVEIADAKGEAAEHPVVDLAQEETASDTVPELPEGKESTRDDRVLKLLINAEEPEECRLALLENGRLESIHVSTITRTQTKNNIYKGRIVAIEPNLQAAFVDYGTEKNGFLPFSEIHPEYYKQELSDEIQAQVDAHQWKKLSITDVVEKGQDVLVQVVKEEVGKKGANMTTYLSLPGRSVVLMPGSDSSGISRKISGEERRSQLRNAMNSLSIPEGIGWIVRTASADITKTALGRDVGYLLRLWEEIKKKAQGMNGVGQVYEDHQSVLRFLREHFDPSIEEILVDAQEAMDQVNQFISLLPSKQRDVRVRLHKGSRPIFNQFSVEDQIESIYQPRVNLPSGGSIVIEPTEALVSIDVNSGSTSKGKNFDQSIYQANMEAASEIGRQLRLRDLGGLIVVDFIDMRNKKHVRDVERQLKLSMKRDKAKVDFSRISKFGLMQISRQKLGSPIEAGNYRVCEHCKGRGTVRSVETLALFYLRRIQTGASRKHVGRVECYFPLDVAAYLLNNKRHEIHEHETRYKTEIIINADPAMSPVDHDIIMNRGEKEGNGKKQG